MHQAEVDALLTAEEKNDRMTELNVQEQVLNLAKTAIIQSAWKKEQRPFLHGWVYSLKNGILKPILEMPPNLPVSPTYKFET